MCSQRPSSKNQTPSGVAADFSLQRNSWTWCVGVRRTNCAFLFWTTLLRLAKCVAERWIQYFGPPMLIIADQVKEFVGTQFKEFTNANSILLHIIDVRAQWQNGRTENYGATSRRGSSSAFVGCTLRAALRHFSAWLWNAMLPRIDCPTVQATLPSSECSDLDTVFARAELTSDDIDAPDPVYDLAATDASFEESRQIRDAAMKAHAEVSILRSDDVISKGNPPSKRGRWAGPVVCIGTYGGSVWVNMRGSLWKCSQLRCKMATTEESQGLEIQNQLLDDMKAEFQEFLGRRVYTDLEREGIPPSDADQPPAAPRA